MQRATQIGEVKRIGGWRGSPNSIAGLMRSQVRYAEQRKCKRCRRIAVRGQDHCVGHLGRWSPLSQAAGRGESRMLARLERAGLLPLDLIALPVWRGLMGLPTSQRAPMRLALIQAWDKRHVAPLRWAAVQRQAFDLASQPGRRRPTAAYYENR
jgi:hypothetical protein